MSRFGQTGLSETDRKHNITEQLKHLEANRDAKSPLQTVREAKSLQSILQAGSAWHDSVHPITASFWNLFSDTKQYKPYLKSSEISTRLRTLIAWAATQLSPEVARTEGVAAFQQLSPEALEKGLETGERLNRPGGLLFETVKELPEPLTEEAARRGAQAKAVGSEVLKELGPIAEQQKQELQKRQLTNGVLVTSGILLFLFVKNKKLAFLITGLLTYYLKKEEIKKLTNNPAETVAKLI